MDASNLDAPLTLSDDKCIERRAPIGLGCASAIQKHEVFYPPLKQAKPKTKKTERHTKEHSKFQQERRTPIKLNVCHFAIAAMVLIVVAPGVANAAECSSSITSCGCTITDPGVYTVTAPLSYSQGLTERNGCIDVAAQKVTLIVNDNAITGAGTGTGVGIHLLRSARGVFLEGAGTRDACCASVSGWQYGLESEASDVISDGFGFSNNTTGVLLNRAENNNINDFNARKNSVYGVWIKGSSGNQINSSGSSSNGVAGVYLGCSATGPAGEVCKEETGKEDHETSNGNFVYDLGAYANGGYGIAVEEGSKHNKIMDTTGGSNTTDDVFDGNLDANCDSNLWQSNSFSSSNQACIQ